MYSFIQGNNTVSLTPLSVSNSRAINSLLMAVDSDQGSFTHVFNRGSSLVRQTDSQPLADLEAKLQNATFLFADENLVDYRSNEYRGFTHTAEGVKTLVEELGFASASDMRFSKGKKSEFPTSARIWGETPFQVPGIGEGGLYDARVSFVWSPFSSDVRSMTALRRLICLNGMVATSGVMDYTIPVVTDWKENLEVAYRRLLNKLNDKVVTRMQSLPKARASVATVQLLRRHAESRLSGISDPQFRARLVEILKATDVNTRLKEFYNERVFQHAGTGCQVASDLTAYDAFNFSTELLTHTEELPMSTNSALTALANDLLFGKSEKYSQGVNREVPKLADFSDADAAFTAA